MKTLKSLWIVAYGLLFVYYILLLPWFTFFNLVNQLPNLALIIVAYIALKRPEGTLISEIQVYRALELYKKVKVFTPKEKQEFGMDSIVNYLSQINIEKLLEIKKEVISED